MIKILKTAPLIFIVLFASVNSLKAQESIIPDISYLFLEKLVATAKQNYPRIKQNKVRNDIASLEIRNEKLNWFDVFSVSYVSQPNKTVNFIDPSFYSGYQFSINVNIASVLKKPNNVKKTKLELQTSEFESKEYEITLETEVKKRYFSYIQALNNVRLYTKTWQDADGLLKDLKLRYERGEVTFDAYSQGLINFSSVSQSKLAAETAYLTAKVAIEELTITRIEDIK
ncbi:MAG: TolC family protein [Bacteroidetes bacterium]|nr:TolC family protein [Bacteroidota bacterium]MBU1484051.1 TolC family protein [Bacteroidota bacterium]MBU1761882.1 TolC family protein [Bacteroidota bacterium]MBU2045108.1 TolC family protein [Bacteroidota bacterium]MBU2267073.1 TolC family protein [Bacteroidota bacterium]